MNEQQVDPMAAKAAAIALERMGANLAMQAQQTTFMELKYQEAQESLDSIMALLNESGIDLDALMAPDAPETNEVAQEEPDTDFPLSAPTEDGDDASATP